MIMRQDRSGNCCSCYEDFVFGLVVIQIKAKLIDYFVCFNENKILKKTIMWPMILFLASFFPLSVLSSRKDESEAFSRGLNVSINY